MSAELHWAVTRTYHAQTNKLRPGMLKIGLSPGQPKILNYLTRNNHCMQKEIATALDIEPATVSQLLNNMAQAGLIQRSSLSERKRAESVSITEKGREAQAKWKQLCSETDDVATHGFSLEEREQFVDFLCRMYQNLTGKGLE